MATPRKTGLPIPIWKKISCSYCMRPKGIRCKSKTGRTASASHSDRYKDFKKREKQKEGLK